MAVPRNRVDTAVRSNPNIFVDLSAGKTYNERMRDKYMVIELNYNNTDNYKFTLPYINTLFRRSPR